MIKIDGFKFSPDPEDVGLDIDIPGFGTWWVDQYWQFVDVPLDELPLHEKFCDEAFADRLNRALDEYIRLVRGDAKSDWFDSHVVVMGPNADFEDKMREALKKTVCETIQKPKNGKSTRRSES